MHVYEFNTIIHIRICIQCIYVWIQMMCIFSQLVSLLINNQSRNFFY